VSCSLCRCVNLIVTNATAQKSSHSESRCESYDPKMKMCTTGLFCIGHVIVAHWSGYCSTHVHCSSQGARYCSNFFCHIGKGTRKIKEEKRKVFYFFLRFCVEREFCIGKEEREREGDRLVRASQH